MSKSKKKSVLYNVSSGILNQLITLSLGIIIPRLVLVNLGSESNGLLNSINQVIIYLALLEGGVGLTITKALYGPVAKEDKNEINGIMSAANIFYRNVGKMYFIGILVISLIYSITIETTLSRIVVFFVCFVTGLPQVINFFFQGKFRTLLSVDGKGYVLTNLSTFSYIFSSLTKIGLLLSGFGILEIQIMYLVINLLQMIYIILFVRKNYSWINLKCQPMNNKIGKRRSVFIHQISGFIFSNTDMIILTYFCDLTTVSIYSIYTMFYSMINTLISNFTGSFNFIMGQTFNTNREKYLEYQNIYETFNIMLTFALLFVLYICIIPFLKLYTNGITDANYIDNLLPLLFMIVQLIQCGRLASQKVIEYAGEFEKTQWHAFVEMILNITVSILGAYFFGIYGVLLGTIIALVFRSVVMINYAYKKILNMSPLKVYVKWFCNIILLNIMIFVYNYLTFNLDTYLSILIFAIICLFISITLFFILACIIDKKMKSFIFNNIYGLINRR
ncbi:lipopolysaccharide biosynthesis protein [Thomasclavelia sp.]